MPYNGAKRRIRNLLCTKEYVILMASQENHAWARKQVSNMQSSLKNKTKIK